MPLSPAVAIIPVRPGGQVLLMLRDNRPGLPSPNRWSTVGGAVEQGETIAEAATREVEEELGLPLGELIPLGYVDTARHHSHVFATRATWSLDEIILGEGQGVDWLSPQQVSAVELAEGIAPAIRSFFASDCYRDLAGGKSFMPPLRTPPLTAGFVKSLGLKSGDLLAVRGATAGFVRRLWDVLEGVRVTASPSDDERPNALLWWPRADSPVATLHEWSGRLATGGSIWAVTKQSAAESARRDLHSWAEAAGLRPSGTLILANSEQASRLASSDDRDRSPGGRE